MKNKIFSILLVFTLVITVTIVATGMSVSAADSNKYNEETLQEVYEELATSSNPQKYFDSLSEEVQNALIKTYAPEAWEAINNIRIETIVTTTETKGGPTTITVTRNHTYGGDLAWSFSHWITWSWSNYQVILLSSGMDGTGYQIGPAKWVYDSCSSYYTDAWSSGRTSYTRTSYGYFDYYVWIATWIKASVVDTYVCSIVFNDGGSA